MSVCLLFRDFDNKILSETKILCDRGFSVQLVGVESDGFKSARLALPPKAHADVISMNRRPIPVFDLYLVINQLIKSLRTKSKLFHCYGMNELLCALALKSLHRSVIYDVGDDVPSILGTMVGRGLKSRRMGQILEGLLRALEVICCGEFDRVIALTDRLARDRSRYTQKTITIGYYPDPCFNPSNIDVVLREKYSGFNVVVYDGRIASEKGTDAMLEIANAVRSRVQNLKLLMIGKVVSRSDDGKDLFKHMSELGLEKTVDITGWVPYYKVPGYLNLGKIGLSLLSEWCYSYRITEPYKILETMACGKPVVATKGNHVAKHLIEQSGGGILVDESDIEGAADCVIDLLCDDHKREEMGARARNFIKSCRRWSDFEEKLLSIYEEYADQMARSTHQHEREFAESENVISKFVDKGCGG